MTFEDAIIQLKEGNQKFAEGKSVNPHQGIHYRRELQAGQNPFALVLTCNDSRICPEIIFDQGLGQLSVVRIGGNILNDHIVGTIEYVLEHLDIKVIIVMGHENCGAVKLATTGAAARAHIQLITDQITPAVDKAKTMDGNFTHNAVISNIQLSVERLKTCKPFINMMVEQGNVQVVGAVYSIETGVVTFL